MVASQAEIWDDSILIESWNDALEEYKKYHSIAACKTNHNESVETFGTPLIQTVVETTTNCSEEDLPSNSPLAAQTPVGGKKSDDHHDDQKPLKSDPENCKENKSVPVMPQHLVGQVHDEMMKNLLISWYYAGYYTGLHEGRQHR